MEQIKISIIIPCYKVAEYLPKCLDSIYQQNIDANLFEVIAIIDGSPDQSENICLKYAQKHSNLKVIKIKNSGVYAARNIGINYSSGEYIWFVDPDDYVSQDSLSNIILTLNQETLDILFFQFNRVDENGYAIENIKDNFKTENNHNIMSGIDFLNKVMLYSTFLWCFVAKREIFNSTKFKENMRSMGDAEYIPRMLLTIKKIKMESFIAYNYVCRNGSISKRKKPSTNLLDGAYESLKTNLTIQKEYPNIIYFKEFTSYLTLTNIRLLSQTDNYKLVKRFFSLIKSEKVNNIIYHGQDKKRRMMTIIYNISPLLCFIISKLFKRQ